MVLPLIAYLFSFVLAFASTMLAATMLTAEVESGVLLPVLSRPLSRASIVVGKFLGLGVVVFAYAAFSGLLEFAIVDATMGFLPPHPFAAVGALAGVGLVMLVFTLVLGTRLAMIASGIVAVLCFGVGWIIGIAGSVGASFNNQTLAHAGTIAQLLLPTDALWRLAVYQLEPALIVNELSTQAQYPGPFYVTAPPPPSMIVWSILWIVAMLAVAARSFSTRDV
jgi:ABC-type transport system involved in multi-copper enzyme maturation permease subunit